MLLVCFKRKTRIMFDEKAGNFDEKLSAFVVHGKVVGCIEISGIRLIFLWYSEEKCLYLHVL